MTVRVAMGVFLLVGAVGLGTVLVVVLALSHRHRWAWGAERVPSVVAGKSPYREGVVSKARPRGVPSDVRFAAFTSITWGLVTLCFAGAGALLAIMTVMEGKVWVLLGLAAGALSLDGLLLTIALIAIGTRLLGRSNRDARAIVAWSITHHAAVTGVFFVTAIAMGEVEVFGLFLMFVALPCALGWAQATQLSRVLDTLDASNDDVGVTPHTGPAIVADDALTRAPGE